MLRVGKTSAGMSMLLVIHCKWSSLKNTRNNITITGKITFRIHTHIQVIYARNSNLRREYEFASRQEGRNGEWESEMV